jgi:glycosyltransferase involved in cell wall biosynthesis
VSAPLVSVAMATYNGAQHLREQLDSIYAQTWPRLEVVATDDASADGTTAILEEYAVRHGLRYAVNRRRLGVVDNFARAISLCRGDYVALADQDDLWRPHKIERLVAGIGDHTLVYCNSQDYITPAGERALDTVFDPIFDFARLHGTGKPTRFLLAANWVVSHSLLFKRDLLAHALPIPPYQPYPDGWLALVASKLGGIKYLDEPLQIYREHPRSATYVAPGQRPGRRRSLRGLVNGEFRDAWRRRCEAETARLREALALPLLDASDRAFAEELITYYRAGLARGGRWSAFRSGLRIAPFVTALYRRPRWQVPLRPLLGGL